MGVLDDAIRQHLELKRKHGAAEEELQRQEEEALGPARREVAQQPENTDGEAAEVVAGEASDGGSQLAEVPVAEETGLFDGEGDATPPVEEREADGSSELSNAAAPEPVDAGAPEPVDPTASEAAHSPEPAPAEPLPVDPAVAERADSAAAPPTAPAAEPPESTALPEPAAPEHEDDPFAGDEPFAEPAPPVRSGDTPPRGIPAGHDEPDPGATQEYDPFADHPEDEGEDQAARPSAEEDGEDGDGDVLEDTPDFLQETPEHDRLWFEQKPPRDFDFD